MSITVSPESYEAKLRDSHSTSRAVTYAARLHPSSRQTAPKHAEPMLDDIRAAAGGAAASTPQNPPTRAFLPAAVAGRHQVPKHAQNPNMPKHAKDSLAAKRLA